MGHGPGCARGLPPMEGRKRESARQRERAHPTCPAEEREERARERERESERGRQRREDGREGGRARQGVGELVRRVGAEGSSTSGITCVKGMRLSQGFGTGPEQTKRDGHALCQAIQHALLESKSCCLELLPAGGGSRETGRHILKPRCQHCRTARPPARMSCRNSQFMTSTASTLNKSPPSTSSPASQT